MSISKKMLPPLTLGAAFLCAGFSPAQAQNVNVQFLANAATTPPTYAGLGAAYDGSYWNTVTVPGTAISNVSLASTNNTATPVTLNVTSVNSFYHDNGNGSGKGNDSFAATNAYALMADYANTSTQDQVTTLSLAGLTPSAQYSLYLYGVGDQANQGETFTLNGVNMTTTPSSTAHTLTQGTDYVKYTATANSSGQISVNFTNTGNQYSPINGLQLQQTAAPTVLTSVYAVAAGNTTGFTATNGMVFLPDQQYNGTYGYTFTGGTDTTGTGTGATVTVSAAAAPNLSDPRAYAGNRYGGNRTSFDYQFKVTAGALYTVRLGFSENYFGVSGSGSASNSGLGTRLFTYSIDGVQEATNYDIFAQTNSGQSASEADYYDIVAPASGILDLNFANLGTSHDNAQINAIQILAEAPEPSQYAALGLGLLGLSGLTLKARKRSSSPA